MNITCGPLSIKNEPVWNETKAVHHFWFLVFKKWTCMKLNKGGTPFGKPWNPRECLVSILLYLSPQKEFDQPLNTLYVENIALVLLPYRQSKASYLETVSNIPCRDENWWLCGSQGKIQMFPGYLNPLPESMWQLASCHIDSGNDHIMYDCLLSGEDAS